MLFPRTPKLNRRALILMLTDQLSVKAFGETALKAAGFQVAIESSGEAALEQVGRLAPDLILSDLMLADMDALELCARLREDSPGQDTPVFIMSDLLHAGIIHEAFAEGATDFIPVPVNWHLLVYRIHRAIALAGMFKNISEQQLDLEVAQHNAMAVSSELLQLRNYDELTGLPNRQMFVDTLGLALAQSERSGSRLAVLFLDLDGFKEINDLIGRSRGDEVLQTVAKRLQGCLRDGDLVTRNEEDEEAPAAVARFSGDQFGILLFEVKAREDVVTVVTRIEKSLAQPVGVQGRKLFLSAKVGIAQSSPSEPVGEEVMVQRAESAMRYCKQNNSKSFSYFESFMEDLVAKRIEVKAELIQALEQDQLEVHYQVIVDSESLQPMGVEGLIRWRHPERGLISPGEFLPVAEESDLIVKIDDIALQKGCQQGREWLDEGLPPLVISLNLSKRFLEQDAFSERVLEVLAESRLPPELLQLELSERGALPRDSRVLSQLDLLKSKGILLAIDDFGTGQTSLAYLSTFPVNKVKIDRLFVSRVPDDSASVAISNAIVAMSHHLGLKVVAEGVEEENQTAFLREAGCDEIQGFLYSRPVAPVEVIGQLHHLTGGAVGPASSQGAAPEDGPRPDAEAEELATPDLPQRAIN